MITPQGVQMFVGQISLMKFFPNTPGMVNALSTALAQFCADDEKLTWLAKRIVALYAEWPGIREVRAVYCSKFKPLDGINAYSTIYGDGIPSERPALLPPAQLALPPGHVVSVDPGFDAAIQKLAEAKALPPAAKVDSEFTRVLRETVTAPQDRMPLPPPPEPTPQIITQEDVDREVEKLRAERDAKVEKP